jgi:hypothetical protein
MLYAIRGPRRVLSMFRAYAPTKVSFDKAWKLPDIERVN